MKKILIKHSKNILLFFLGLLINISALTIVMMKFLYPFHRWVSLLLYIVSWLIFIYLLKKLLYKKFKDNKQKIKKLVLPMSLLTIALCIIWALASMFAVNSIVFLKTDKDILDAKSRSEQVYTEEYIKKLSESEKKLIDTIQTKNIETATVVDKEYIRSLWREYLSYFLALESINNDYKYFYQINLLTEKDLNQRTFMLAYSSFLAKYSSALNIIKTLERGNMWQSFLNEKNIENEIPNNAYTSIQKAVLKPENFIQMIAGRLYMNTIKNPSLEKLKDYSFRNYENILAITGRNADAVVSSAVGYFENKAMITWFPVQKKVAEVIGDTKVPIKNSVMIDSGIIQEIQKGLKVGDVFLQRRNWYLSNVGLPGFWKHTAIYLGSLDDLDNSFEPSYLTENMKISDYIRTKYPKLYEEMKDGEKRTIEAESEGIVSLTLEKSMSADYAVVLRPKLNNEDKLKSLLRAFTHFGKAYDFDFDFLTDSTIVCSELYYKAFPMIDYNLRQVSGRMVLSSNDIARDFDENYSKRSNELEFVYFIDADERKGKTYFSDLNSFRKSWKRSELDITKNFIVN